MTRQDAKEWTWRWLRLEYDRGDGRVFWPDLLGSFRMDTGLQESDLRGILAELDSQNIAILRELPKPKKRKNGRKWSHWTHEVQKINRIACTPLRLREQMDLFGDTYDEGAA